MHLSTGFRQISRGELQRKLHTMTSDLKSKGTIDDPVAKKVGWMPEEVYSFENRLADTPGDSISQMREAAQATAKQAEAAQNNDKVGWMSSLGIVAVGLAATPVVGVLGCGLLAGVGALCSGAHLWNHCQHRSQQLHAQETVKQLDTWQHAFSSVASPSVAGVQETPMGFLAR